MKKLIATISLACYFVLTCGVVVNSHYCMKRLVSTHLFESKAKKCGKCGMGMHKSNGCCHDEVKVIKLVQDQTKIPAVHYELPSLEQTAMVPSEFIVTSFINTNTGRHFYNHSPPLLSAQDTYLQNNVFRI
jgi:hypothetical protein